MSVRPVETQISLGIRPVWSESSLCAQCVAKDPMLLHADSDDSDQTGRMLTAILLVLSCRGSYTLGPKYPRYMYTRTYKKYTHVYWVQEIHERINLKEYISSIYAVMKKYFVFALSWKKYFDSRTVRKKNLFFYWKKILRKKTKPPPTPPAPENRMVGP